MIINIQAELNKRDVESYNSYDLLNVYRASELSSAQKQKIAEMLVKGASNKKLYEFMMGKTVDEETGKAKYYIDGIEADAADVIDTMGAYDLTDDTKVAFDSGDPLYIGDADICWDASCCPADEYEAVTATMKADGYLGSMADAAISALNDIDDRISIFPYCADGRECTTEGQSWEEDSYTGNLMRKVVVPCRIVSFMPITETLRRIANSAVAREALTESVCISRTTTKLSFDSFQNVGNKKTYKKVGR